MGFRAAIEAQVATVLEAGTTAPHALPGNLSKWNRDATPTDDLTKVFYEQEWIGDPEWLEQGWTGSKRLSQMRMGLTLSTFLPEALVEKGEGAGSLGREEARRRLEDYWEPLRWRLAAEAHWNQGTTAIVAVLEAGFDGRERTKDNRMIRPMQFLVVFDEAVS